MKHAIKQTITAVMAIALLIPVAVSAHPGHDHDEVPVADRARQDVQAILESKKQERVANQEARQADLTERLDASKKKICERNESKINNIINNIGTRHKNAFDRITKISNAVSAYSNEKSLSFVNYDAIIAKINVAKAAAQSAIQDQQSAKKLDCNTEQPRADMSAFKEKRLASVDALNLYHSAVKELITAVKEAAKTARTTAGGGGQ